MFCFGFELCFVQFLSKLWATSAKFSTVPEGFTSYGHSKDSMVVFGHTDAITRILLAVVTHAFAIPQERRASWLWFERICHKFRILYILSYCGRNGLRIWLSTTHFRVYGFHLPPKHSRWASCSQFLTLHKESLSEFHVCSAGIDFWSNLPGCEMHTCVKIWDSEKMHCHVCHFQILNSAKSAFQILYTRFQSVLSSLNHSIVAKMNKGLLGFPHGSQKFQLWSFLGEAVLLHSNEFQISNERKWMLDCSALLRI